MYLLPEEVDKILYSLSFLRATPFIEKLEVHVSDVTFSDVFFGTTSFLL